MREKLGIAISVMGMILMVASLVAYNHHVLTQVVYSIFSIGMIAIGIMVATPEEPVNKKHTR